MPLYRIRHFVLVNDYVKDYTLRIYFDDGSEQTIDFSPVLYCEVLGPLCDLTLFNQVMLDLIAHTLTWPSGADFDPETLRN